VFRFESFFPVPNDSVDWPEDKQPRRTAQSLTRSRMGHQIINKVEPGAKAMDVTSVCGLFMKKSLSLVSLKNKFKAQNKTGWASNYTTWEELFTKEAPLKSVLPPPGNRHTHYFQHSSHIHKGVWSVVADYLSDQAHWLLHPTPEDDSDDDDVDMKSSESSTSTNLLRVPHTTHTTHMYSHTQFPYDKDNLNKLVSMKCRNYLRLMESIRSPDKVRHSVCVAYTIFLRAARFWRLCFTLVTLMGTLLAFKRVRLLKGSSPLPEFCATTCPDTE
jgi:hypothetical protein